MQRFKICFLIRHPDIDPDIISAELGWKSKYPKKAGDRRVTPKGTLLEGFHKISYWNYYLSYTKERNVTQYVAKFVDEIYQKRFFLKKLTDEGGQLYLFINLPGNENMAGSIDWTVLEKMVEMKMEYGFEVFADMPEDF